MTVQAKAIVTAFYESGPRFSYWNGCSSGGKQGLKEAQRFPITQSLWVAHATLKDPAAFIPPSKYPLINKAVIEACDALDGVTETGTGSIDEAASFVCKAP